MEICAPGDQLQLPSAFQRTVVGSLTRLRPDIFVNRLLRTRMIGGVGAGGEKPPATRLCVFIKFLNSEYMKSRRLYFITLSSYTNVETGYKTLFYYYPTYFLYICYNQFSIFLILSSLNSAISYNLLYSSLPR